jgi:MarR family transcriptional regulator, organic hydroperoxide resistance regulator
MEQDNAILFLEKQLCFPLYAASRLTIQQYTPYLNELDLTYPQYLVFLTLWEHNELNVNALGEKLHLASNTLTPLLKRMEEKGWLNRTRATNDERVVNVTLTNKGQALKYEALKIPLKLFVKLQNPMISEDELKQFQKTLWKLISILSNQ